MPRRLRGGPPSAPGQRACPPSQGYAIHVCLSGLSPHPGGAGKALAGMGKCAEADKAWRAGLDRADTAADVEVLSLIQRALNLSPAEADASAARSSPAAATSASTTATGPTAGGPSNGARAGSGESNKRLTAQQHPQGQRASDIPNSALQLRPQLNNQHRCSTAYTYTPYRHYT